MHNQKLLLLLPLLIILGCSQQTEKSSDAEQTSLTEHDYLRDFEPLTESGLVNVVIEIPTGSIQKWEVNKESGFLEWEIRADTLRKINYLPYPANYGMVHRTWLPVDEGGDNDPLDIILLGDKMDRGSVVPARIVGVLKMLDSGEQDDKLIAVDPKSHFYGIHTLQDLENNFPGVVDILTIWFESYKGGDLVQIQSVDDEEAASRILKASISSYRELFEQ